MKPHTIHIAIWSLSTLIITTKLQFDIIFSCRFKQTIVETLLGVRGLPIYSSTMTKVGGSKGW